MKKILWALILVGAIVGLVTLIPTAMEREAAIQRARLDGQLTLDQRAAIIYGQPTFIDQAEH
jgi:hypothetical protein